MNRNAVITLAIAAILLIVLVAVLGSGGSKRFKWNESYKAGSKQPYGTHVMREMLDGYNKDKELTTITKSLSTTLPDADSTSEASNFVFIGEAMYLDTADVTKLLDYVADGNKAFIACKTLPYDLMFYLYYDECDYTPWDDFENYRDTVASMNFFHNDLKDSIDFDYKVLDKNKVKSYDWNYIDSIYFCGMEYGFVGLGGFKGMWGNEFVNFAMIPYKDPYDPDSKGGVFYIHTNPMAFTNLQMLDETGKQYAERVFTHLHDGDIYWSEFGRIKANVGRRQNARRGSGTSMAMSSETPLKYILEDDFLKWAWYSLLGMAVLYLMFRAKRKQRIVPVMEENSNTSLEFISTIGALFYNKPNHKKLAMSKMKMFLAFLRSRYGVSTKKLDKELITKLSAKSGVASEKFENLFKYYGSSVAGSQLTDENLKNIHRMMDEIQRACK